MSQRTLRSTPHSCRTSKAAAWTKSLVCAFSLCSWLLSGTIASVVLAGFSVTGRLNMTNCCLRAPFTGHIVVEESEAEIQSIELQLVRVETTSTCRCHCVLLRAPHLDSTAAIDGATTSDATEIQNLQVGDGDVPRGLSIPLYMIFPRLFACPSVAAGVSTHRTVPSLPPPRRPPAPHSTNVQPLSVNFELNIHIRCTSDYLVLENFPISACCAVCCRHCSLSHPWGFCSAVQMRGCTTGLLPGPSRYLCTTAHSRAAAQVAWPSRHRSYTGHASLAALLGHCESRQGGVQVHCYAPAHHHHR